MGVPVIQLPADIMATQEAIWRTRPDVIIETGVARGGSVIFLASMLELMGNGRVVGIDIDIRPHNRQTIESHPLSERIKLITGSSVSQPVLSQALAEIDEDARVMVILDSDHSMRHVLEECRLYGPLVTKGCYLVLADTALGRLTPETTPRNRSQLLPPGDEPLAARDAYLRETDRFIVDMELNGKLVLSSSPGGYLLCVKD